MLFTEALGGFIAELIIEFIIGYTVLKHTGNYKVTEQLTLSALFKKTAFLGLITVLIAIGFTAILYFKRPL
jgi:hypothetical protein